LIGVTPSSKWRRQVSIQSVRRRLKAVLDRTHHRFAVVAERGWRGMDGSAPAILGPDDELVAPGGGEPADQGLSLAKLVRFRGVDEIAVGLDVAVEDALTWCRCRTQSTPGSSAAASRHRVRQANRAADDYATFYDAVAEFHGEAP